MNKNKNKRKNKFLVIVVLVIGALAGKKAYYEATKDNLVLDEVIKVEYKDADNLFEGTSEFVWYDNINNYAYTIKEDNLTEGYYKYLQENKIRDRRWLIYDLVVNDQYCQHKKVEELNDCYVSEDTVKFQNYENTIMQYELGIAIIESTNGEQAIYGTTSTEVLMEAIDYASVISQGSAAPGYGEAMEWSYNQYKSNDGQQSYANFAEGYLTEIKKYEERLKVLSNMSLEEIVENYDEYGSIIATIRSSINPGSL